MAAVADRMEKKYRYTAKGKINPYAVSAFGIASGRMQNTSDVLKRGMYLGALGSFDVDADGTPDQDLYIEEDPIISQIRETKVIDNRYAWRLNCEDGAAYGVSPYDYETREEYNQALRNARGRQVDKTHEDVAPEQDPSEQAEPMSKRPLRCCRVSRLDNGVNEYYLTDDTAISVGDMITVQTDAGIAQGVVIAVKKISEMNKAELPDESMWIISQEDDDGAI